MDHQSLIELGQFAKLKECTVNAIISLSSLVSVCLKRRLIKDDAICLSQWSSSALTQEQKMYAAHDAYASLQVWHSLSLQTSVGLPITSKEAGQHVGLYYARKLVAQGHIPDQPPNHILSILYGNDDTPKTISVTTSHIVLAINKILVPGQIISLHQKTLAAIQQSQSVGTQADPEFPFLIVVQMQSVWSASDAPPVTIIDPKPSIMSNPLPTLLQNTALENDILNGPINLAIQFIQEQKDDFLQDSDSESDTGGSDAFDESQSLQDLPQDNLYIIYDMLIEFEKIISVRSFYFPYKH